MHDNSHPLIVVYGNTQKEDFPLILVVGREPNNNVPFDDSVGNYDFEKAPRCNFWNTAYKVVADTNGINVRELKDSCKKNKSSILAFTDLSPRPLLIRVKNKEKQRSQISKKEFDNHILKIFSKNEIINRVGIIILSGVKNKPEFIDALNIFKKQCGKYQKSFLEIPFLYSGNYREIKSIITESQKNTIMKIYRRWKDDTHSCKL